MATPSGDGEPGRAAPPSQPAGGIRHVKALQKHSFVLASLAMALLLPTMTHGYESERVVVVSIDGLRATEAFEERPCVIPLEYMVSLSIHRLLYDGIKQMQDEGLIVSGLGSLDRRVRVAPLPPFPYDPKGCPREEIDIVSRAQKPVTLRALGWRAIRSGNLAASLSTTLHPKMSPTISWYSSILKSSKQMDTLLMKKDVSALLTAGQM